MYFMQRCIDLEREKEYLCLLTQSIEAMGEFSGNEKNMFTFIKLGFEGPLTSPGWDSEAEKNDEPQH